MYLHNYKEETLSKIRDIESLLSDINNYIDIQIKDIRKAENKNNELDIEEKKLQEEISELNFLLHGKGQQFISVYEHIYNEVKIKGRNRVIIAFFVGIAGSLVANYLINLVF